MSTLDESQDLATACGLVLSRYLSEMLGREAGTRSGVDPEDLHQMRVALRMLRAALRIFRPAMHAETSETADRELVWINDALGAVRDLDVFLDRLRVTRSELDRASAAALGEIEAVILRRRDEKRCDMIAVLNNSRYGQFVSGFRKRIETRDLALFSGPAASKSLDEYARVLLKRFVKKAVRAAGTVGDDAPPEVLHATRRKVRRLRYGLNFFGSIYGAPARDLRKQARRIQNALGEYQDAMVAQSVLRSVFEELRGERSADPEVYFAIGQAIQREARHAEIARAAFFDERDVLKSISSNFIRAVKRRKSRRADGDEKGS